MLMGCLRAAQIHQQLEQYKQYPDYYNYLSFIFATGDGLPLQVWLPLPCPALPCRLAAEACADTLGCCPPLTQVRQTAGLLLKNNLKGQFAKLPDTSKQYIKVSSSAFPTLFSSRLLLPCPAALPYMACCSPAVHESAQADGRHVLPGLPDLR